jgi:RHS repeat-associated protein
MFDTNRVNENRNGAAQSLRFGGRSSIAWIPWLLSLLFLLPASIPLGAAEQSSSSLVATKVLYDADGQRVGKQTVRWEEGEQRWRTNLTRFLIDPQHPSGYAQRLAEEREDGEGDRAYLHGLHPIAEVAPDRVRYALVDGHRSVRGQVGEGESLIGLREYDAFGSELPGRVAMEGETGCEAVGYAGEFYDPASGLQDLRARQYEPLLGRFRTMDSYEGRQGLPAGQHKYAYASANPVNKIDPSGHFDIVSFAADNAIRGGIAGATFGSISAGFSYAKGATAGAALEHGLKVAALTEFAFLSPLAAVSFGGAGVATTGLGVYSGDITADDLPELATYVIAGYFLHASFSSGVALEGANFAQTTYRTSFSKRGAVELSKIVGAPIKALDDLVAAIKNGTVRPDAIPVHYIIRNGKPLILNTRTSVALEKAGIPRSEWKAVNVTGDQMFEGLLNDQLKRNGLGDQGASTVTPEI